MRRKVKIGDRWIGEGEPTFIVAELGTNHNQDIKTAKKLIDIAAEANVDGVKFQIYHPTDVVHKGIEVKEYGLEGIYREKFMWEVFQNYLMTPREWFPDILEYVDSKGLVAIATVSCKDCAQFMFDNDIAAFKVASMDLTHLPFLRQLAEFGKPIILSTGMGTLAEISEAVDTIKESGNTDLILLHCVSNYPAEYAELNLSNIKMLINAFNVVVGFSDHTMTPLSSAIAVALGAKVIEKHITLDRNTKGPDHPFALEPDGLRDLVSMIRETEKAVGTSSRSISEKEMKKRALYRRSLVAKEYIRKGEKITSDKVQITRPGSGIEPKFLDIVTGREAKKDIEKNTIITWEMV